MSNGVVEINNPLQPCFHNNACKGARTLSTAAFYTLRSPCWYHSIFYFVLLLCFVHWVFFYVSFMHLFILLSSHCLDVRQPVVSALLLYNMEIKVAKLLTNFQEWAYRPFSSVKLLSSWNCLVEHAAVRMFHRALPESSVLSAAWHSPKCPRCRGCTACLHCVHCTMGLCCDAVMGLVSPGPSMCVLICCIWLCLLCLSLPLLWPAACFLESLPSLCVLVYMHQPPVNSLTFLHTHTHNVFSHEGLCRSLTSYFLNFKF